MAKIKYSKNEKCSFGNMNLELVGKNYSLTLQMEAQKAPVWHCDDGKLMMGYKNNPKEMTYYYSLTNIKINGNLVIDGKSHNVEGKAWFDRQGGTYTLTDPKCNWEWFSLRFNDNEEIMLFYFPQTNHQDGTYIKKDGTYQRMNDYNIVYHQIIESAGYKWTYGWKLTLKGEKEGIYQIIPLAKGQLNLFFYELLAQIIDRENKIVGYCVVELLPGARNDKISRFGAFRKQK